MWTTKNIEKEFEDVDEKFMVSDIGCGKLSELVENKGNKYASSSKLMMNPDYRIFNLFYKCYGKISTGCRSSTKVTKQTLNFHIIDCQMKC